MNSLGFAVGCVPLFLKRNRTTRNVSRNGGKGLVDALRTSTTSRNFMKTKF